MTKTTLTALVTLSLSPLLTGCGTGVLAPSSPPLLSGTSVTGRFMGGQQPIANTKVQLYESGVGGYGLLATPLGISVTTNASGNFNLPSYSCDAGRVLYIVGTGGQPIAATQNTAAVTNNNIAEVGLFGVCGLGVAPYVNVNELTTVATVWALQPFMTGYSRVSTSSSNAAGILDAVQIASELVDPTTGTISRAYTPANATIPSTELNTLADMLEQCVNSGGGVATDTSTSCGSLFSLAPDAAGTTYPTDTIAAALNIAKNPGRNVAALNRARSASPVFQPVIDVNSPPTSWTVAITYNGGGMNSPSGVAVDAGGNIWVTNKGNNTVTELDPTGATTSTSAGYTSTAFSQPSALAVDQNGSVWVANAGNSSLVKLNSDGTTQGTTTTIASANSVTIDQSGNAVVTNGSQVATVDTNGNVQNAYSATGTVVGVVSTTK